MTRTKPFTTVRIDQDLYDKLKAEAVKKGVATSVLVNEGLRNWFETPSLARGGFIKPGNKKMVVDSSDGCAVPLHKLEELGFNERLRK